MDAREAAVFAGKAVDPATGLLRDEPGCCTNWEPVELGAGSVIAPLAAGVAVRVWCYVGEFDESLAREYSYDAESNWTTLRPSLGTANWLESPAESWTAPCDCFVRVTARISGSSPTVLGEVADIRAVESEEPGLAPWFRDEADRVCQRVESLREPGDLVLIALSDIHYSTGCIWPETARNVRAVAERIHPDAIVQLGDVSDGIAPVRVTRSFVGRVLGDLRRCGVPVYGCVGNHDANYFKGNAERLSTAQCAQLYIGRDEPWYYEDFPAASTRCVFLQSFEPERKERYGYTSDEVRWLRKALYGTPQGYKVLVFSHLPLYAEIHHWSDTLLNEDRMVRLFGQFNKRRGYALKGFVHGHSHVDQTYWKQTFPDIAIGCAKFEDFEEFKPEGSVTPARKKDDASQDLWDVLILKGDGSRLEFVRFGAGEDRSVIAYDPTR